MVTFPHNQAFTHLNNGIAMPLLGLGAWDMYGSEAEAAVSQALEIGYCLIDTAAMYRNETEVGHAVNSSGIPRSELFVTTKVHNAEQGYDQTLRAFDASLKKLGGDYIDLYLVHWPIKTSRKATWQAIERLYAEGKVRAIGVANYLEPFLDELKGYAQVVPAVNQVEFSPWLFLEPLMQRCQSQGTVLQAYSPLVRGQKMGDPRLQALAAAYGKPPAQIILRWAVQLGVSTIPKSSNPARLQENFGIFDFEISPEDMARMATFHENYRVVEDPMEML
ncbi:MAG: aldo/keto reductase [Bacteroidetes bacterium]|nr:MAG: aldo/keto reductase [Bacteroidota bacterium]